MVAVINIGGTSRSGSTMLHLMLGNAPDAFACGEAINWFRPEKTHHFNFDCACGKPDCPVWSDLKYLSEDKFYPTAFEKLPINYLIDSSKELSWLLDARGWTGEYGINHVNLFIWKDPLDLAYSFWKRKYKKNAWRKHFVTYFHRVQETGLPILAVNYNDLVRSPEQKVEEICAAIDMPYFIGKERFWEKDQHHLFGSFGVRRQVQIGESIILTHKTYHPDFEKQSMNIHGQIANDAEVQQIVKILQAADVATVETGAGACQQFRSSFPYPTWYYMHRVKRLWHQRFPRKTDLMKSKKVATIPVSDKGDSM